MEKQKIDYQQIEKRKKTLEWFQNAQLAKLLGNSHKGSWRNQSNKFLLERLIDEMEELKNALDSGSHFDVIMECADVANFAMFIADKHA